MEIYHLLLPAMGEGIIEATITKWFKNEGDEIKIDDCLLEVATDKIDSDIPADKNGILIKIHKKVNEIVKIGEVIAEIEVQDNEDKTDLLKHKNDNRLLCNNHFSIPFVSQFDLNNYKKIDYKEKNNIYDNIFLSPLVKSIINEENISNEEIKKIKGTGLDGRITKDDLMIFLSEKEILNKKDIKKNYIQKSFYQKNKISIDDEVIEMDRMTSLISNYMVESKKISPHVTSFIESDVTNLVLWKKKNSSLFLDKYFQKLTFTPLFIYAIVKAIKDFPMINISVIKNKIIKKKNINIGIATAIPNGGLIVPVIKNADQLSISELAKSVNDLVYRARCKQLNPHEIIEGTYTLTNIGTFGNLMGTPIINQPQVAIMAIGIIQKKVSVIETKNGDHIAIREKVYLSHTYDHRVIDGALGGMFLKRVSNYLENFNIDINI